MPTCDTEIRPHSDAHVIARNGLANLFRLCVSAAIGVLLPAILTRRLSAATYSAWLLILQLGAYIGFLMFSAAFAPMIITMFSFSLNSDDRRLLSRTASSLLRRSHALEAS